MIDLVVVVAYNGGSGVGSGGGGGGGIAGVSSQVNIADCCSMTIGGSRGFSCAP